MTHYLYLDNSGIMSGKENYRNAVAYTLEKAAAAHTKVIIYFFSDNVDNILQIESPELVDLNKIMDVITKAKTVVGGTVIRSVYKHFEIYGTASDSALIVSDLQFGIFPDEIPENMFFTFADGIPEDPKEHVKNIFAREGIMYKIIDIPKNVWGEESSKEGQDSSNKEETERTVVMSLESYEIEYISLIMQAMEKVSRMRTGDPKSPTRIEATEIVLSMQGDPMSYVIAPSEFDEYSYSLYLYKN